MTPLSLASLAHYQSSLQRLRAPGLDEDEREALRAQVETARTATMLSLFQGAAGAGDVFTATAASSGAASSAPEVDLQRSVIQPLVASLRDDISMLSGDITALEATLAASMAKVSKLERDLAQRVSTLKEEQEENVRTAILFAMFGGVSPAVAGAAALIANDKIASGIEHDVKATKAQTDGLRREVASYEELKSTIESQLQTLRASETSAAGASPIELRTQVLTSSRSLVENLKAQVDLLTTQRSAAAGANIRATNTIAQLKATIARVEDAIEQVEASTLDLIERMVSPDPTAALQDWIDDTRAAAVKDILTRAGLSAEQFVDRRMPGLRSDPAFAQTRAELIDRIRAAGNGLVV